MKRPILAVLAAFAGLAAISGCAGLSTAAPALGANDYATLRASPNFAPAWANPTARPWMLDALDAINRVQGQRDAASARP